MSDIDEVKTRTNIIDIIGARVTLKKAGRHFKALCPFHSEKTPSFIVSPERQSWKCFGCGKGGSVIDFVMEHDHVDFLEALESLAEKAGVKLTRRHDETPESKLKQRIFEANHLASEYYHFLLTKHVVGENARSYLKTRGVSDKTIKTFILGYSPNSWDGLLNYLKKKGYDEKLLEHAGLTVSSGRGGDDPFRGRVLFTLKDHRGNTVGFSGRLLDPDAKEAKYINTSETLVYSKSNVLYGLDVTKAAIQKEGEAIITEGEFDVISSFQAGVGNVVAIKGSALTEGHVNLLRRFAERLVFALDSDVAGDAASRRGIEVADRAGLDMRVVTLPSGKDPDEAVRENPGALKSAIKHAIPIYDYFIGSAIKRFDTASSFGKKKVSEELLPIIAKIDNPIVQAHYVKELGKALSVSEEAIGEGIKKAKSTALSYTRDTREKREEHEMAYQTREEKLEVFVLALVLQGKTSELFDDLTQEEVAVADFSHPPVRQILERIGAFLPTHPVFLVKDFADSLPKELLPILDEAFLWDIGDVLTDEERFAKQWAKATYELKRTLLRRQIQELARGNARSEKTDEQSRVIQGRLGELTGALKALENKL